MAGSAVHPHGDLRSSSDILLAVLGCLGIATLSAMSAVAGSSLSRTDNVESLVLVITAFMAVAGHRHS